MGSGPFSFWAWGEGKEGREGNRQGAKNAKEGAKKKSGILANLLGVLGALAVSLNPYPFRFSSCFTSSTQ